MGKRSTRSCEVAMHEESTNGSSTRWLANSEWATAVAYLGIRENKVKRGGSFGTEGFYSQRREGGGGGPAHQ
jgi:hypothetical protein